MAMSRRELLQFSVIGAGGVLITMLLGFGHWGAWAQLGCVVVVTVLATLGAPHAFGWSDPRPPDHSSS